MALKAATIFNHLFGEDDEFSLCCRHEEAVALRALKNHHRSELVFREILATRTTMLTCRQLELDSMYGLAENLDHLREHVKAESLYSQALELSQDKYGEVSTMTLGLMRGLSRNPSLQGRYEESTNISLEVVRLRNDIRSRSELANNFMLQGQYTKAQGLYLTMLDQEGMVREMDQVDVGRDLLRVAETYSKTGNHARAEHY